jgi:hypothetical protein
VVQREHWLSDVLQRGVDAPQKCWKAVEDGLVEVAESLTHLILRHNQIQL